VKDPSSVHFETDCWEAYDWPGSDSLCNACLTPWPCPKWQKWTKSNEYRIGQLEERVKDISKRLDAERELTNDLKDKVHRLEVWAKGVMPALGDVLAGKIGGTLRYREDVEYQDITLCGGYPPMRMAGLRDYSMDYSGPDGDEYHNGVLTERNYSKP
jgi:hypothetical protein